MNRPPAQPPPPTRIEAHALTKRFGAVEAVTDLTFTAAPGTVTGFLGPNGAGKTTTLRMLLGLVRPTSGTATIGGLRYAELPDPPGTVGALLDSAHLHPARTARDHLRVYGAMAGCDERRIEELIGMLELGSFADRPARGYSTGMRRRLGLATALLPDPPVLVLDEPGNGLDPRGIAWLRGLLRSLAAEGRTVLVSSHVLGETQQLVDDVVIIDSGRLVAQGPLAELTGDGTDLEQLFLRATGGHI
ncbi:ABC transporter ATP-binding protein [Streptomyces sp. NPDC058001]|uniref:ABC transporter ATP-binding protein n=1 Tax=Streptomyces sp. NPDC058001 TaxID=3346300 RepID=UPI0036EF8C04